MEKVYRKYPPKTSPSSKQPMHAKSSSENKMFWKWIIENSLKS